MTILNNAMTIIIINWANNQTNHDLKSLSYVVYLVIRNPRGVVISHLQNLKSTRENIKLAYNSYTSRLLTCTYIYY